MEFNFKLDLPDTINLETAIGHEAIYEAEKGDA